MNDSNPTPESLARRLTGRFAAWCLDEMSPSTDYSTLRELEDIIAAEITKAWPQKPKEKGMEDWDFAPSWTLRYTPSDANHPKVTMYVSSNDDLYVDGGYLNAPRSRELARALCAAADRIDGGEK